LNSFGGAAQVLNALLGCLDRHLTLLELWREGGEALTNQVGTPVRMEAEHLLHLVHSGAQTLRRRGSPRIALAAQDEPTTRTTTQGGKRRLIAFGHGIIHPAEVSIGIGRARRTDRASSEVHINHQRATGSHQREHLALEKGAGDLLKDGLDSGQGGFIGSGKRAADTRIVGEGRLLPRGTHRMISDEGMRSQIEILKVVEAAKDADEELDQLILRRMCARALGDGDGLQALNEAEVLGEFAEYNQSGMIGGQVEGRLERGTEMVGGMVWPLRTRTRDATGVGSWAIDERTCSQCAGPERRSGLYNHGGVLSDPDG
jgi:hypothetical protein